MRFSLEVGLMLRHGKRTLEFVRELPDGEVQLEDVLTRRAYIVKTARLIHQIMACEYQVVLTNPPGVANAQNRPRHTVVSLASLPVRHRQMVEHRYAYVRALKKARITRGRRLEVERCVKATADALKDDAPPSASTVMRWARRYESANNNISALVDGRLFRSSAKQIHPVIESAMTDELKRSYFTRDRHSLVHAQDQLRMRIDRLAREGKVESGVGVSYSTLNQRKIATPYDLFSEGVVKCPPAVYPGSFDELRLAAAHSKVLALGKGGIELSGLPYGSVDFGPLVKRHGPGLKVLCKWDPDDTRQTKTHSKIRRQKCTTDLMDIRA